MLEPKAATFHKLQKKFRKYQTHTTHVEWQQFLNHMYPPCHGDPSLAQFDGKFGAEAGCWSKALVKTHNKFTHELTAVDVESLLSKNFTFHQSLRFHGDGQETAKPWMRGCMGQVNSSTNSDSKLRKDVLNLWMREFQRVKPVKGMEHLLDVECPAYSCAAKRKSLDYVMLVKEVKHCVTRAAITRLAKFAQPRQILLIAPGDACNSEDFVKLQVIVGQHGSKLQCVEEDRMLPEISKESIQAWLNSRFGTKVSSHDAGNLYLVDNSELQAHNQGLGFHLTKKSTEPGYDQFATWGTTVNGTDEGDGWLKVSSSSGKANYLPITWDGSVVLRKLSEEQHMEFQMGHDINDTMAESYHQQFLKLATAEIAARLSLSEHYVIWDSDMLLLRDFCPFNSKGQINFM